MAVVMVLLSWLLVLLIIHSVSDDTLHLMTTTVLVDCTGAAAAVAIALAVDVADSAAV